jgi:aspartate aminotransferase
MSESRFISDKIAAIGSSGIRRIFDLAATMKDPIDLSMGQPDFPTPQPVKDAAIEAIRNDRNGYTVTHGLPELREKIASGLRDEFDWSPDVLVTCGVSGALTLALMTCLNPGDEVVMADPYFVSYKHLVNLAGGRPVMVPIYPDFVLSREAFAAAITPRTKMILINSPANPSGVVHSREEITGIVALACEHDLLIVSDEIYNMLSYDETPFSPVSIAPERTLLLRGFSKSYAVAGWRMACAAGPEAVIQQMAKLQQFTFVCAPQPAQVGSIAALDTDMSHQVEVYRKRRDLAVAEMKDCFSFAPPSGGFFVYAEAPSQFASGTAFVEEAIRNNVLAVPGCAFSERDTHFRISYAVPDEKLKRGCEILRRIARES